MVAAEEVRENADAMWITWAKAKADWFDPTVAAKDMFFGKRNHKLNMEQKCYIRFDSPCIKNNSMLMNTIAR